MGARVRVLGCRGLSRTRVSEMGFRASALGFRLLGFGFFLGFRVFGVFGVLLGFRVFMLYFGGLGMLMLEGLCRV